MQLSSSTLTPSTGLFGPAGGVSSSIFGGSIRQQQVPQASGFPQAQQTSLFQPQQQQQASAPQQQQLQPAAGLLPQQQQHGTLLQQQQTALLLQQQQQATSLLQQQSQQQQEEDRGENSRSSSSGGDTCMWGGRVFERLYNSVILPFTHISKTASAVKLRKKLQQLQAASIPPASLHDEEDTGDGAPFTQGASSSASSLSSPSSSDEGSAAAAEEELEDVQQQLQQLLLLERRTFAAVMLHADAFLHLLRVPERQRTYTGAQLLQFVERNYPGWVHLVADIDAFSLQHNIDQRTCFALLYDAVEILTTASASSSSSSSSPLSLSSSSSSVAPPTMIGVPTPLHQQQWHIKKSPPFASCDVSIAGGLASCCRAVAAAAATAAAQAAAAAGRVAGAGEGGEKTAGTTTSFGGNERETGREGTKQTNAPGEEAAKRALQQQQHKLLYEQQEEEVEKDSAVVVWDPQLVLYALQRAQHYKLRCLLQLALNIYSDYTIGILGDVEQQSNRVAILVFSELARKGLVPSLIDTIADLMSAIVCPPYILAASRLFPAGSFTVPRMQQLLQTAGGDTTPGVVGGTSGSLSNLWGQRSVSSAAAAEAMNTQLHQVRMLGDCMKLLHIYLARFQASLHDVDALLQLIPHVLAPQAALSSTSRRVDAFDSNSTTAATAEGKEKEEEIRESLFSSTSSIRRSVTAHDYDAKLQAAAASAQPSTDVSNPFFTAAGDTEAAASLLANAHYLQQQWPGQVVTAPLFGAPSMRLGPFPATTTTTPVTSAIECSPNSSTFLAIEAAVANASRCCFNGVSLAMRVAELLLLALHPKLMRWSIHAGKGIAVSASGATRTVAGATAAEAQTTPNAQKGRGQEIQGLEEVEYPVLTELNCLSSPKDIENVRRQHEEAASSADEDTPPTNAVPWDASRFYRRLLQTDQSGGKGGAFWRDTGGLDSLLRFVICGVYTPDGEQLAREALHSMPIFPMLYLLFLSHRRSAADIFGMLSRQLLHEILWLAFVGSNDIPPPADVRNMNNNIQSSCDDGLVRLETQQIDSEEQRSLDREQESRLNTTLLWRQLVDSQLNAACNDYINCALGDFCEEDILQDGRRSKRHPSIRRIHGMALYPAAGAASSHSSAGTLYEPNVFRSSSYRSRWQSGDGGPSAAAAAIGIARRSSQPYERSSKIAAVYEDVWGRERLSSRSSSGASLLQQALYLMNAVCQGYPAACSQYTGILTYCVDCFAAVFSIYPQAAAACFSASSPLSLSASSSSAVGGSGGGGPSPATAVRSEASPYYTRGERYRHPHFGQQAPHFQSGTSPPHFHAEPFGMQQLQRHRLPQQQQQYVSESPLRQLFRASGSSISGQYQEEKASTSYFGYPDILMSSLVVPRRFISAAAMPRPRVWSPMQQYTQKNRLSHTTPQRVMRAAAQALGLNIDVQPELLLVLLEFAATLSSLGGPSVARQIAACFGGEGRGDPYGSSSSSGSSLSPASAEKQQQQLDDWFFLPDTYYGWGASNSSSSVSSTQRRRGIDLGRLLLVLVKQLEAAASGQYTALPSQCAFVAADYVTALQAIADKAATAAANAASTSADPLPSFADSATWWFPRSLRDLLLFRGGVVPPAESAAAEAEAAAAAVEAEVDLAAAATQAAASAATAACKGGSLGVEGAASLMRLMDGNGHYPRHLLRAVEVTLHLAASLSSCFLLFVLPFPYSGFSEQLQFFTRIVDPTLFSRDDSKGHTLPQASSGEGLSRLLLPGVSLETGLLGSTGAAAAAAFRLLHPFSGGGTGLPFSTGVNPYTSLFGGYSLPGANAPPSFSSTLQAWDGSWPPPPWLTHVPMLRTVASPTTTRTLLLQQQQRYFLPRTHLLDVLYALLHVRSTNEKINMARIKASCLFALTGNFVRNPATALAVLLQLSRLVDTLRRDVEIARRRDTQLLQEQQQQHRQEQHQHQQQQQQPQQRGLPSEQQQRWSILQLQFIQTGTRRAAEIDGGQLLIAIATCAAYNLQLVGIRRRFDASLAPFWLRSSSAAAATASSRPPPPPSCTASPSTLVSVSGVRLPLFRHQQQQQQSSPVGGGGAYYFSDRIGGAAETFYLYPERQLLGRSSSSSSTGTTTTPTNIAWSGSPGGRPAVEYVSVAVARELHRLTVFLMEMFLEVFGKQQDKIDEVWQWIPQGRYWRLAALLLRCFRLLLRGPLPRINSEHVDTAAREPYRGKKRASAASTSYLLHSFLSFESPAFDTLLKLTCYPFSVQQLHYPTTAALLPTLVSAASATSTLQNSEKGKTSAAPSSILQGSVPPADIPGTTEARSGSPVTSGTRVGLRGEQQSHSENVCDRRDIPPDIRRLAATAAAIGQRRAAAGAADSARAAAMCRSYFCEQVSVIGLDILRILFQRDALYIAFARRGESYFFRRDLSRKPLNEGTNNNAATAGTHATTPDRPAGRVASTFQDKPFLSPVAGTARVRSEGGSIDRLTAVRSSGGQAGGGSSSFWACQPTLWPNNATNWREGDTQKAASRATQSPNFPWTGAGAADVVAGAGSPLTAGCVDSGNVYGTHSHMHKPDREWTEEEEALFMVERQAAASAAGTASLCYVHEQLSRKATSLVEALCMSQAIAAAAAAAATAGGFAATALPGTAPSGALMHSTAATAAEAAAADVLTDREQLLFPFVRRQSYPTIAAAEKGRGDLSSYTAFAVPPYTLFAIAHLLEEQNKNSNNSNTSNNSASRRKLGLFILQQMSLRDPSGLARLLSEYPVALQAIQTGVAAALLLPTEDNSNSSTAMTGIFGDTFAALEAAEQQQQDETLEVMYWRSSSSRNSKGPATVEAGGEERGAGAPATAAGRAYDASAMPGDSARPTHGKKCVSKNLNCFGKTKALLCLPTAEALADPFYSPLLSRYFLQHPSVSQRHRLRSLLLQQRYEELLFTCNTLNKQQQESLQGLLPSTNIYSEQQRQPPSQGQGEQQIYIRRRVKDGGCLCKVGASAFLFAAHQREAAMQEILHGSIENEQAEDTTLLSCTTGTDTSLLFGGSGVVGSARAAGGGGLGEGQKEKQKERNGMASRLLTLTEDTLSQRLSEASRVRRAATAAAATACWRLLLLATVGSVDPAVVEDAAAAAGIAVTAAEAAAAAEVSAVGAVSNTEVAAAAAAEDMRATVASLLSRDVAASATADGGAAAAGAAATGQEDGSIEGETCREGLSEEAETERFFNSPAQQLFYSECKVVDEAPFSSFCGDIGDDATEAQATAAAAADTWTRLGSGSTLSCYTALPLHRLLDEKWQHVEDAVVEATDLAAWQSLRLEEKHQLFNAAVSAAAASFSSSSTSSAADASVLTPQDLSSSAATPGGGRLLAQPFETRGSVSQGAYGVAHGVSSPGVLGIDKGRDTQENLYRDYKTRGDRPQDNVGPSAALLNPAAAAVAFYSDAYGTQGKDTEAPKNMWDLSYAAAAAADVSLASIPRPLEYLSVWVEGGYLAPAGNSLPPPSLWLLPPSLPPGTSFFAATFPSGSATTVSGGGSNTGTYGASARDRPEGSAKKKKNQKTASASSSLCYFAYAVVPAAYHQSSFHCASLRRLALLLLHSGMTRACRPAGSPIAGASICCCSAGDTGSADQSGVEINGDLPIFPLMLLGLRQQEDSLTLASAGNCRGNKVFDTRSAEKERWSASTLAVASTRTIAAAAEECTRSAAAYDEATIPGEESYSVAGDGVVSFSSSSFDTARVLRPLPRTTLQWLPAATRRKYGASAATRITAETSQVGWALLQLIVNAPPCLLLEEDIGDPYPHAADTTGYFDGEWQRHEKILIVYEQQWELLVCLQVLQLLAAQSWGRTASIEMVEEVWTSRYHLLEHLLTLPYGEVPQILRPLLLLQLSAVLQICLVELQEAAAARRRRVLTSGAAAVAASVNEQTSAAERQVARGVRRTGYYKGMTSAANLGVQESEFEIMATAEEDDLRETERVQSASDVYGADGYNRALLRSNERLYPTPIGSDVWRERGGGGGATAAGGGHLATEKRKQERSRKCGSIGMLDEDYNLLRQEETRKQNVEEIEKVAQTVQIADMLLDTTRQGGSRDLFSCFIKLLLFFQKSVTAQPPLQQLLLSALDAAAVAVAGGGRGGASSCSHTPFGKGDSPRSAAATGGSSRDRDTDAGRLVEEMRPSTAATAATRDKQQTYRRGDAQNDMQTLYEQNRLPAKLATLFEELTCVEYKWDVAGAAARPCGVLSVPVLLLFNPLYFVKLRDQLLSPLLQSPTICGRYIGSSSSSGSCGQASGAATAEGDGVCMQGMPMLLQWLAVRASRLTNISNSMQKQRDPMVSSSSPSSAAAASPGAAAAAAILEDTAFCGEVLTATLVSLWVWGFRQNSSSFTAAALRAVLELMPALISCCFDLLSPVLPLLASFTPQQDLQWCPALKSLFWSFPDDVRVLQSPIYNRFSSSSYDSSAALAGAFISATEPTELTGTGEPLLRLQVAQRIIEMLLPYLLPPLRLLRQEAPSGGQQQQEDWDDVDLYKEHQNRWKLLEIVRVFHICVEIWSRDVAAAAAGVAAGTIAADLEARLPRAFAVQLAISTVELLLFLETFSLVSAGGSSYQNKIAATATRRENIPPYATVSEDDHDDLCRPFVVTDVPMGKKPELWKAPFYEDMATQRCTTTGVLDDGSCQPPRTGAAFETAACEALLRLYLYNVLHVLFSLQCFAVDATASLPPDEMCWSPGQRHSGRNYEEEMGSATPLASGVAVGLLRYLRQDSSSTTDGRGMSMKDQKLFHMLLVDAAKKGGLVTGQFGFPESQPKPPESPHISAYRSSGSVATDSSSAACAAPYTASALPVGTANLFRFLQRVRGRQQAAAVNIGMAAASCLPLFGAGGISSSSSVAFGPWNSLLSCPYPTAAAALGFAANPTPSSFAARTRELQTVSRTSTVTVATSAFKDNLALTALLLLKYFFEAVIPQQQHEDTGDSMMRTPTNQDEKAQGASARGRISSLLLPQRQKDVYMGKRREDGAGKRNDTYLFINPFHFLMNQPGPHTSDRRVAAVTAKAAADQCALDVLAAVAAAHLHGFFSGSTRGLLNQKELQLAVATLSLLRTACNQLRTSLLNHLPVKGVPSSLVLFSLPLRDVLLLLLVCGELLLLVLRLQSPSLARAFATIISHSRRRSLPGRQQLQWSKRSDSRFDKGQRNAQQQREQWNQRTEGEETQQRLLHHPRLLDVVLSSPVFAASLGSVQVFRLVASPFFQTHPRRLPTRLLRETRVCVAPLDLFFGIGTLLQHLLRIRPVSGLLIDRILQWTNGSPAFFLSPLVVLSRLAAAAAAAAISRGRNREPLQQLLQRSSNSDCTSAAAVSLLPFEYIRCLDAFTSLTVCDKRRRTRRTRTRGEDKNDGSNKVDRGSSGARQDGGSNSNSSRLRTANEETEREILFMRERIDHMHIAACISLRLLRILLESEGLRKLRLRSSGGVLRSTSSQGISGAMSGTCDERAAAVSAAAAVAADIKGLRSQFFYMEAAEDCILLWVSLLLVDIPCFSFSYTSFSTANAGEVSAFEDMRRSYSSSSSTTNDEEEDEEEEENEDQLFGIDFYERLGGKLVPEERKGGRDRREPGTTVDQKQISFLQEREDDATARGPWKRAGLVWYRRALRAAAQEAAKWKESARIQTQFTEAFLSDPSMTSSSSSFPQGTSRRYYNYLWPNRGGRPRLFVAGVEAAEGNLRPCAQPTMKKTKIRRSNLFWLWQLLPSSEALRWDAILLALQVLGFALGERFSADEKQQLLLAPAAGVAVLDEAMQQLALKELALGLEILWRAASLLLLSGPTHNTVTVASRIGQQTDTVFSEKVFPVFVAAVEAVLVLLQHLLLLLLRPTSPRPPPALSTTDSAAEAAGSVFPAACGLVGGLLTAGSSAPYDEEKKRVAAANSNKWQKLREIAALHPKLLELPALLEELRICCCLAHTNPPVSAFETETAAVPSTPGGVSLAGIAFFAERLQQLLLFYVEA